MSRQQAYENPTLYPVDMLNIVSCFSLKIEKSWISEPSPFDSKMHPPQVHFSILDKTC